MPSIFIIVWKLHNIMAIRVYICVHIMILSKKCLHNQNKGSTVHLAQVGSLVTWCQPIKQKWGWNLATRCCQRKLKLRVVHCSLCDQKKLKDKINDNSDSSYNPYSISIIHNLLDVTCMHAPIYKEKKLKFSKSKKS